MWHPDRSKEGGRTWLCVGWLIGLWLLATPTAAAVDEPVIRVAQDSVVPDRIDVHVGELVRWWGPSGQLLRLELDPHPTAHEIVVRETTIGARFLKSGAHSYSVSVAGSRARRGTVMVLETLEPASLAPVCGPGSSARLCIEP